MLRGLGVYRMLGWYMLFCSLCPWSTGFEFVLFGSSLVCPWSSGLGLYSLSFLLMCSPCTVFGFDFCFFCDCLRFLVFLFFSTICDCFLGGDMN